jgi:hypothetical protein
MSAPGFTPVQLYRSTTAAAVPTAGNLVAGELAINLTDEKLYFENASGVVKVLADSTYVGTVTSVNASGGTTGMTFSGGPITGAGTLTLAGTLAVANGGTGTATTFTAGSVVFAGASGVYSQDNANLFWDNANDRLGIGTTSPGERLAVSGNIQTTNATYNFVGATSGSVQAQIAANGSGGTVDLRAVSNHPMTFNTNNTERMRIDSSGNVMVGTTSATGLFSVAGMSYGQMIATDRFGVLGNNLYYGTGNFRYIGNGHGYAWTQANTDGADYRLLYAGNNTSGGGAVATPTERLYIASDGRLGIGTASLVAGRIMTVNGSPTFISAGSTFNIDLDGSSGANGVGLEASFAAGGYGPLRFRTGGAETMRIASNGFVGVGTSTDNGIDKLTVAGIVGAVTSGRCGLHVYNGGATAEWFIGQPSAASHNLTFSKLISGTYTDYVAIDTSGNVGIGTGSPVSKLSVSGSFDCSGVGKIGTTVAQASPSATDIISTSNSILGGQGGNAIYVGQYPTTFASWIQSSFTNPTTATYNIVLQPLGGNVGIGNASPTVTLDVTGGIKTSRTAVTSPATSDGNIFSGTYTPTLTNVANIDIPASTAYTFQYMRVGNVVTVSGKIDVTVTGTGLTRLNVSLPISSNFSAEENCAGTAVMTASSVSINIPASIRADTTNDVAEMRYWGNLTGMAQAYLLTFTYRII